MSKQRWAIVVTGLGCVLLCLWALTAVMMPTDVYWDEQDQLVYEAAAERQHQAGHRMERATRSASEREMVAAQQEVQAARREIEAEQKRLAAAQNKRTWIPRVLLGLGAAAIVAGLALLAR